ncbi:MAG: response regulator transcription factor [Dehalococcoidia bacterium]|nr:response regulator transcription factor [Dehalococcoidia bacterium]
MTTDAATLAGVRIAFIAERTPVMLQLEASLAEAGAHVAHFVTSDPRWQNVCDADVCIVHVPGVDPSTPTTTGAAAAEAALQRLVASQQVIALLEEPALAALPSVRDFVLPPFRPSELVLRVQAALRHARPGTMLRAGNLDLHVANRLVAVDNHPVTLTFGEFEILHTLPAARGRPLPRDAIRGPRGRRDDASTAQHRHPHTPPAFQARRARRHPARPRVAPASYKRRGRGAGDPRPPHAPRVRRIAVGRPSRWRQHPRGVQ